MLVYPPPRRTLVLNEASHVARSRRHLVFMHTPSKQQKPEPSGRQFSSHFILYKSKHTSGAGARTTPLEWDGVHFPARLGKRDGRPAGRGLALHPKLRVFLCQMRWRAVSLRARYWGWGDATDVRALSSLLHSAALSWIAPLLFSNKPESSLLLTCLFVCVTSSITTSLSFFF